jgi:cellulose biosynthesis protein BcsQ
LDGGVSVDSLIFVFLDDDRAYLEMISSFIHDSSYHKKIQLKTFTQRIALDAYLETTSKFDLLAIQADRFDPQLKASIQGSCIVLLGENNTAAMNHEATFLNKYQPLNLLLDRLLAFYANHYTKALDVSQTTQIISVYSAVGGTGKTTAAANLAKLLAFLDHKVFYLNLELFPSVSMFPAGDNKRNFEQLLYYVQVQAELLFTKLESLKHIDPLTKVEYFEPIRSPIDMEEMTGNTVETILKALTLQGNYDYIIIDLDHSLHERIVRALTLSHQIIWLVLDDLNSIHKSTAVCKEFRMRFSGTSAHWMDNIHYVLNKFTGRISNDFSAQGIQLSGQFPYVPQWKSVFKVEQLMSENAFHGHLLQWFYSVNELSKV